MKSILTTLGLGVALAFVLTQSNDAEAVAQDAACLADCAAKAIACQQAAGEDVAKLAECVAKQVACQESC